jgi:CBS domain-containing protein
VDDKARLTGVMTRSDLAALAEQEPEESQLPQASAAPIVAYPRETLRTIAERMATRRLFVLPVIDPGSGKLLGLIKAEDLLQARARAHQRENKQERLRMPFGSRPKSEALRETA